MHTSDKIPNRSFTLPEGSLGLRNGWKWMDMERGGKVFGFEGVMIFKKKRPIAALQLGGGNSNMFIFTPNLGEDEPIFDVRIFFGASYTHQTAE